MAGRFPGACTVAEFWQNQLNGVESISRFSADELEISDSDRASGDSNFVPARSVIEDADQFDAEFFGIHPREAERMDPQHRLFLETCWQALEDGGYDPGSYQGSVGVFAGASMPTYFLSRLCQDRDFIRRFTEEYHVGNYVEMMGNSPDFLATRVAYKLNLRGPAFTLQAGCSTSLIAVCQACQSLLTYQCDMALAGGSSITFPQKRGSKYQDGGMTSPDGHCRTFDADAQGTVFGSGVAAVLLKRLEDAVEDGDAIYAVIRGFALNNDGSAKVGYTAPSVEGQSRVIAMAQEVAGVHPEEIGYIEAHGTATPLGDPIELAALTRAFRAHTAHKEFCAIGTAKTNVGHLDVAAGVTGLIHAARIVGSGILPPTLHFQKPNPKFDLANSPFYVSVRKREWKNDGRARIAGVSAFGVGGTNAHVILEEAPPVTPPPPSRTSPQLLVLSARSEAALGKMARNLAEHLKAHPDVSLAEVAWTLQSGRRAFRYRRAVIAKTVSEAVAALAQSADLRSNATSEPAWQLLAVQAAKWEAGEQIDWSEPHRGGRHRKVSLPTYPFERKRYWLETTNVNDPRPKALGQTAATQILPSAAQNAGLADSKTRGEDSLQRPEDIVPGAGENTNRARRIAAKITTIFESLSGERLSGSYESANFLDLGFDSLFLTQVTQALQTEFRLKITFRQLLGDLSTIEELSRYLDSKLPPDATLDAATATPSVADASAQRTLDAAPILSAPQSAPQIPTGNGWEAVAQSGVERLLRDQLQAMNQLFAAQLEVLRGSTNPAKPMAPLADFNPQEVQANAAATPSAALRTPASGVTEEFKPFGPYKPPQKGTSGKLTERQQRHLQELTEQHVRRTMMSKALTQKYRPVLADPRVVSGFRQQWKEIVYPIIADRSKGSRIWDIDGNEYIDILNGFGPIFLGHRPDFVEQAIENQLHQGFEIGPQTRLAGEVAELFCDLTGNERMTFCNTGSEAVIAALRVARTVTGRSKVVFFAGAYHGMFDEVLVKGVNRPGSSKSVPIAPGIPIENVGNVTVLSYGIPESLEWIRQNATDLAAVLVEPVQSRHPNLQPREFLRELRNITASSGTALIFDEVVTGFRVHPGGCQALFGIRADLATYGKVLAGGMPIGVLAGKAEYMDALDGGMWRFGDDSLPEVGVTFFAGTFVRHPLAVAAAKAVLQHLKSEGAELQERLTERTAEMVRVLNRLFEQNSLPIRIEQFASIFYFSFPSEVPGASLFYYHLREKGVYLLEGFPCFLTTAHSHADIQAIIAAFREAIVEMQTGGFFPEPATQQLGALDTITNEGVAAAVPPPVSEDVPLTESQREILLAAQLSSEASCAFNESYTLELRGRLNRDALLGAMQELVDRHDVLRATILPEDNSLRLNPQLKMSITPENLSSLSAPARDSRVQEIKKEEATRPFDLRQGPLLRARFLQLEEDRFALIVTSHHIVCDGWSTNVMLDEIAKVYSARAAGKKTEMEKAGSFREYALRQEEEAGTKETQATEAYWLDRFKEPVAPLELPTDRLRPSVKSYKGATYRIHIDAGTYRTIKQAGAAKGCTLFVTLLTGFVSLLHRLTDQNDIVVGIPTAGQCLLGDTVLVGHCVNFLPLRARLEQSQTAAQLMQQVKQTLLDAYEHQSYTYGTLVRKLKLRRDPSRLPLVEVQFNLERVGDSLEFSGLDAEVDPNPKAAVNFDLFLNVVESASGVVLDCDYNSDLFERESVGRWLGHFVCLLKGIAANPDEQVQLLPLLSESERDLMLVRWNTTSASYPRESCVHHLIEEQAARTPHSVAVVFGGQSLIYAELNSRANQLAHHLIRLGATPGTLIGVAVERSLEMLVALLGIWKAGAAYVPLDPSYPTERLAFILKETSLPLLITQSDVISNLPPSDARLICLDRDWPLIATESGAAPVVASDPGGIAYTIYTSGSTGKPKGVEVTHRNLVNLLCAMRDEPGISRSDRLVAVTTLSFDIAALELFGPLVAGGRVILASNAIARDGRRLRDLLRESDATVMQATPATWQMLIEAGWEGRPGFKILCGGEALSRQLANDLAARGELWNMYGPTETTVWSSASRVEAGTAPVTIGPPIRNTQFYVLDRNREPRPIGVPGELYIGGDGVARGYFKNSQLTAERFLADPFSATPDSRLYRTGDSVRRLPDGRIEFLGRLDNQVKVRGFRIELGEIESVVDSHIDVRQSVAIAQQTDSGPKRLVCYVLAKNGNQRSSAEMRDWVAQSLPEYMVPSLFFFVTSLPLLPNGKVDRNALAAMQPDSIQERKPIPQRPRNRTEELLAAICSEVLQLSEVNIEDSVFDLGADSIHIFQIIARAEKNGFGVTPQQIGRLRTIAALAREIDSQHSDNGHTQKTLGSPDLIPVSRDLYEVADAAPSALPN
jgi:amino acid adenylation domain-containing protein